MSTRLVLLTLLLFVVELWPTLRAQVVKEAGLEIDLITASRSGKGIAKTNRMNETATYEVPDWSTEDPWGYHGAHMPATVLYDPLGSDMGEPQVVGKKHRKETLQAIADARTYLQTVVHVDPKYEPVREVCVNKAANCAFWAAGGHNECEKNSRYMKMNCAPVCQSCEYLSLETRCPMDPDAKDALYPGDLNAMFERILTDPAYQQYEPVVVSRPSYAPGDGPQNATYQLGMWLVMFENALSGEEADRMIELGHLEGYRPSADVGDELPDGTHELWVNRGRTSTNAWCKGICYEDPTAKNIIQRIEDLTGIPAVNQESLQLLRYEEGQRYNSHSDYIPYHLDRPCGVRVLTLYMYLNDVEEGGETYFSRLGIEVKPKRGRAVLWPSVYDTNPNRKDRRSEHEARAVVKGVKYGANAWIHQRDFKTAHHNLCT